MFIGGRGWLIIKGGREVLERGKEILTAAACPLQGGVSLQCDAETEMRCDDMAMVWRKRGVLKYIVGVEREKVVSRRYLRKRGG